MVNRNLGNSRSDKGPKKSSFKYQPRTAESVKKRAERTGGNFDSPFKPGVDTWRPKAGDNQIRILPPTWDEHEHYGYTVWVHSYVGPDNSTYTCPYKMQQKKCPMCMAAKEAKTAGEAEEAKALSPKELSVAWIIDRDEDKPMPQLYAMSWTMDRDIAALCHNKRTGKILLIDHPDAGYDVNFKRSGAGLKTKYFGIAVDRDSSPIVDDEKDQEEILDYIQENPIPSMIKFYDYDFLDKVLSGTVEQKDEDLDKDTEQEEGDPPPRRAISTGRSREEPEEEEQDDPPPRRTARRAPAEEDDPPPRRTGRVAREEPEPEEDPPRRTARRPVREEPEPEDDPPPRRRSAPREEPEEEDDPPPRTTRRAARQEPEPEDDPPPRRSVARERVRPEPEPEEEEETDEGVEEEEEADTRPARRARR